jgi:hypothetical protein
MLRLIHRLAPVVLVASFVASAVEMTFATPVEAAMQQTPCHRQEASLVCCCEQASPASTVPPASAAIATLIAAQSSGHGVSLPVLNTDDPRLKWDGAAATQRAGRPLSLSILHSALLL